jgi:very-short-patch-repair endonuclease
MKEQRTVPPSVARCYQIVMPKSHLHITRGQYVVPEKLERARLFRKNPTPDERTLWRSLRSDALAGLHFRRQQVIAGFIADFYCAQAQVAIELDGAVHSEQAEDDAERDRILASRGIRTIRIISQRVQSELAVVLEEIRAACQSNLTPLPPSPAGKGESDND